MGRVVAIVLVAAAAISLLTAQDRLADPNYPFRAASNFASPRIARLRSDVSQNAAGAVEEFWEEMQANGAPIIESIPGDENHSRVTFVWRGSPEARNVIVVDGVALAVGGVDPMNSAMTHIAGTDVWYRTYDIRNDARFTYSLSENDPLALFTDPNRKSNSKPDPLNTHRLPVIGQTYLELPEAPPQPWITPIDPAMAGMVASRELNGRTLSIYTPRGFQTTGSSYPLIVVMGGNFYRSMVAVVETLDHLIAGQRIPPVVAVAVSGSSEDLQCSPEYARFLAEELVPWMRMNYHATGDPQETVIAGSSLGGLASSCAAVNHPDVFGNVLSQSGSYWWNRIFGSRTTPDDLTDSERLTRQIQNKPKVPVQFFLEVGRMEFEGQLETNRRMRDTLLTKGYDVHYQEFNGNHSYVNWRGSFGEGLLWLLGR